MEQFYSEVGGQETNFSCIREKSNNLNEDLISEAMEDDSGKNELASVKHAADGKKINAIQNENKSAVSKHSLNESVRKGRSFQMVEPRKYLLRSSLDGARTLTSLSNDQNKTSTQPVVSDSVPKTKERRKKRNGKVVLNDEFSLTRKRIRYLLNRISYEQSLIDAYSYEGWRGQSLEKIRPEKELERAKSEILHRKLRIRESMHHLDSLLSEGRIEKNVSDDDDEIDSENIFCAKCGSKDSSVDNDIILCDGSCDRGFHQKCLKPPLHEIPPGDQGWLCPGCDCKVDCFDLLNEFQGSDLSIEDTWEKVFPEAAAIANGNKQDDSIYPSDDSEDDDYDPDIPEVPAEGQEEGSSSQELSSDESSEELDSTSLSEDSGPQKYNSYDVHGLPSDDSEDDDFDPENLNPNKNAHKEGSESDESDFTSDSDEFCAELCKVTNMDEVTSLNSKMAESYGEAYYTAQKDVNAGTSTVGAGLPIENSYPVSKKKLRDQLNYKKLYDEAYGKASSDSTKEEGWIEKGTPKEDDKDDDTKEYATLPRSGIESVNNQRSSTIDDIVFEAYPINIVRSDQPQIPKTMPETTPSKTHEYFGECGGTNGCNATASRRRHLDKKGASGTRQIVLRTLNNIDVVLMTFKAETFLHLPPSFAIHSKLQSLPRNSAPIRLWRRFLTGRLRANYRDFGCTKLLEIFKENHYPSRQMKESLAEELGVTIRQIGKWFENSRRSLRASVKGSSLQDDNRKESAILPDAANQSANTPTSLRSGGIVEEHPINMINSDQPQVSNAVGASTPSEPHQSMDEHHSDSSMHCPNGNKATPSRKHFGQKVYQKLQEIFTENQYPSSGVKKSLSEELGLSAKQISKWFEKSRSRQRISAMESNTPDAQASVSQSETNLQGAGQNTLSNSSRKNTNSGNRNTTSVTAKVSNAKTSSKKNNSTNQVGHATQGNKKIKRKEFDRHKALERELRKRRKIR